MNKQTAMEWIRAGAKITHGGNLDAAIRAVDADDVAVTLEAQHADLHGIELWREAVREAEASRREREEL